MTSGYVRSMVQTTIPIFILTGVRDSSFLVSDGPIFLSFKLVRKLCHTIRNIFSGAPS